MTSFKYHYYNASQRFHALPPDWLMLILCLVIVLVLQGCTTDYRTDYEKNNGIELTEEQIEARRAFEQWKLKDMEDEDRDKRWRQQINNCPPGTSAVGCIVW